MYIYCASMAKIIKNEGLMLEQTLPEVDLAISEIREAIRCMEKQADANRQEMLNNKRQHLKEYLEKRAQLEFESALQVMFGSVVQLEQKKDARGYIKEYHELRQFIKHCRAQSYQYVTADMLQVAEIIGDYYKYNKSGGIFSDVISREITERNRTTLKLVKQVLVANTQDNRDALISYMQETDCGDYYSVKRKSNAAIGFGALMIFLGVASFAAGVVCIASLALLPVGFGLLCGVLFAVFGAISISCGRAQFSNEHPHFALQSFVKGSEPYTFFGKVTKSTHKAVVERETERARACASQ